MPYFLKLSEKNNKDGSLNMEWVRKFIDVAAYVSVACEPKSNWIAFWLVKNKRHSVRTDSTKNSLFITTRSLEDPISDHYLEHEHQTQSNVPPIFNTFIGKMSDDNLLSNLYHGDNNNFEKTINLLIKMRSNLLGKILRMKDKNGYIHITCNRFNKSILKHGLWSEEILNMNPKRRTIDRPEPEPSEYLHDLNEITDLLNDLDELDSSGGTLKRKQKNKNKSRVKKSKSNRQTRRRY